MRTTGASRPTPGVTRRANGLAWWLASSIIAAASITFATPPPFQGAHHLVQLENPAIQYQKATPRGPVAKLIDQINRGKATLQFDQHFGYLPSLLKQLDVPVSSQMLVYSRTSLQVDHISPETPRALYFNDDVYVGFVQDPQAGTKIEIASADPVHGAVFYTLDQRPQPHPRPARQDSCLQCHASGQSMGVPGHLARSHLIDQRGDPVTFTGDSSVDHRTPMAQRWGGWYLTGDLHGQTHLGNRPWPADDPPPTAQDTSSLPNLDRFLDTSRYLSPHSDVVALMVYEHQRQMHNFITRLNFQARIQLRRYGHIHYLHEPIEAFLRYLLFVDEAPLAAPVTGTSSFQQEFEQRGPTDSKGRSLRQFNLHTRLFKYPCSYLIYSDAFDQLPEPLLDHIYQRLFAILSGEDRSPPWDSITRRHRKAILEILLETKPNLPQYWRKPERGS